ncbi:hypothetical protein BZG36_03526 [Bifiguratus adelaidae]|uniref:Crinkler effector protein N-terminal domain-containing protein n=1 Tax=Bifiguratus adelaidae TaxID=1938954 RepID=A0A261XZI4_9FUNG|nr:hypothetical protein BZG36_03526 [Bifiguratus adelaidae]
MRSFGHVWGINIPRIIFDNQFDNYLDNISDAVTRALLGGGQAYGHASSSFVNSFSDTKTRVIETFNEALKLYVSEFNITLSSTANVWKLRVAVQQECTRSNLHFQDIRLDKLDVYKASLSPNESKAILQELKGGRRVTNSEWKTSLPGDLGLLSDYFTKQPDKRAIHLVVDCTSAVVVPATGPPATEPRWSIDEEHQDIILQEVGEFLASSFERLRQFDSRRFLLPRYEPNPQHSEYRAISSLNIPRLLGKPSLLMHNLPRNGTGGVVDVQGFTNSLESGHQLGVIVGASGSGKSRTAIEILCRHFGFYFTCATGGTQHAFGSKDMQYMLESIKTRCSDPQKVVENDNYTKRFATRVVLTRVYILCYLLNTEIELSPYEWTMMQLFRSSNDDIFMSVARMFRPLSAYDAEILLIQYIQKLQKSLNTPFHLQQKEFTGAAPLYTLLVRHLTSFNPFLVIPCGSALSLKTVENFAGLRMMETDAEKRIIVVSEHFPLAQSVCAFLSQFNFPFPKIQRCEEQFHQLVDELQAVVGEPLVVDAAWRYFEDRGWGVEFAIELMAELSHLPTTRGKLYEEFLSSRLPKLLQHRTAFSPPLPYSELVEYRPEIAVKMCVGTPEFELSDFMENPTSTYYLPTNQAGLDLVGLFSPSQRTNLRYVVFLQAKLTQELDSKDINKVIGTTNPSKFFRVVVAFPLNIQSKGGKPMKTVPFVKIDATNASLFEDKSAEILTSG